MSNKMLIDATHPEETRVAVVRGNRIEEYDFESQEKKQLRGNIYLAKVTRVEPSLQAAFIDYGGNRHGFLAFSEIHPDYYQIPVADRQALIEAEAAEARASREADEAEDNAGEDEDVAEASEEAPKKPKRTRRARKPKKAAEEEADASPESEADASVSEKVETEEASTESSEEKSAEPEPEETKKPRRRTSRKKPAAKKAKSESDGETEDKSEEDGDDDAPKIMSAVIEVDEISEPLPEDNASDDDNPEESGDDNDAGETTESAAEKPKRRRASRPRKRKNADADAETEVKAEANSEPKTDETASEETGSEEPVAEAEAQPSSSDDESADEAAAEKPKRRSSRRKPSRKKKEAQETADASENGDDDTPEDGDVESVGQEDALEEVPLPRRARKHYKIQEVIKRRQVLLVQVVKEERGTKGAALTTYLSLAGRYSVLMPNTARGGGISRKITNSADRKRLKAIASELEVPEGMGVILRTAGAARTKDEINRDFEYLMRLWEQVRTLTLASTAPCLVYEEGSLIKRSIRDLYDKDTGEILVAGDAGFNEAKEFMGMLMPGHERRVKRYKGAQAIFAKNGVEAQLDKMVSPQVTLKSGGYLVINQTEALVAVDVNSGRSTREHSVEDTALQTNLEAAEEVARQLRLRDLAGLIVIDFIDMEERRNNRAVEKKLKDCLKNDRARIQVGRISHFGLLEMSRQRMRASVLESTMDVCENCAGTGYVRSASAISLHVFRAIEEHVSRHNKFDCIVKTTPAIAISILNHKRLSLIELEKKYGLKVLIEGDAEISGQEFKIEKGEPARGDTGPAPVGYQSEVASESADPDTDDAENDGRRKRSRRRGKKQKDASEVAEAKESSDVESSPSDESDVVSEDAENQPKKKRTRGKRGGRRNRDDLDGAESKEAGTEDDNTKPDNSDGNETSENAEPVAAEAKSEKPKTRSTVRRKAPIAPKAEEPEAKPEEKEPAEASSPPPRKPRRTTRRAPAKDVSSSNEPEAQPMAAGQEAQETNTSPSVSEPAEKSGGSGKKKSGWWNRGFFQ